MGSCMTLTVMRLLVQRELYVIAASWRSMVISACVYAAMLALSAGYFMPQLGMPLSQSMVLYLGAFAITALSLGYTCAISIAYDLQAPRLTFYYYALPVDPRAVLAGLVAALMLRIALIAVPVLFFGFFLIGQWHFLVMSYLWLAAMMTLSILFFALLFLLLAYRCPVATLLGNVWPRFLSPLIAFGCLMYPFSTVQKHAWWLSRGMLCNPLTYMLEGLRAAFFGQSNYLALPVCALFLIVTNVILSFLVWGAARRAINPVVPRGRSV